MGRIDERYDRDKKDVLGGGTYATVYGGTCRRTGERVALKKLRHLPPLAATGTAAAAAAARVAGPNPPTPYNEQLLPGRPFDWVVNHGARHPGAISGVIFQGLGQAPAGGGGSSAGGGDSKHHHVNGGDCGGGGRGATATVAGLDDRGGVGQAGLREIKVLRELRHPHIIRLRETVPHKNTLFLVFDFAAGGDLEQLLYPGGTTGTGGGCGGGDGGGGGGAGGTLLCPGAIKAHLKALLEALAYCHGQGVLHRDVKPNNLLLDGEGRLLLADFGLARYLPREAAGEEEGDEEEEEREEEGGVEEGGGGQANEGGLGARPVRQQAPSQPNGHYQRHGQEQQRRQEPGQLAGQRPAHRIAVEAAAGGDGVGNGNGVGQQVARDEQRQQQQQQQGQQGQHRRRERGWRTRLVDGSDAHPVMTHQIGMRWYRPPELLFGCRTYGTGVDIWAAGCVFAEMMLGRVWFKGNSDVDQLKVIFRVLGAPSEETWPGVSRLPNYLSFSNMPPQDLTTQFPDAGPLALDLLAQMVRLCPHQRPTAQQALAHPYFTVDPPPLPPGRLPTAPPRARAAAAAAGRGGGGKGWPAAGSAGRPDIASMVGSAAVVVRGGGGHAAWLASWAGKGRGRGAGPQGQGQAEGLVPPLTLAPLPLPPPSARWGLEGNLAAAPGGAVCKEADVAPPPGFPSLVYRPFGLLPSWDFSRRTAFSGLPGRLSYMPPPLGSSDAGDVAAAVAAAGAVAGGAAPAATAAAEQPPGPQQAPGPVAAATSTAAAAAAAVPSWSAMSFPLPPPALPDVAMFPEDPHRASDTGSRAGALGQLPGRAADTVAAAANGGRGVYGSTAAAAGGATAPPYSWLGAPPSDGLTCTAAIAAPAGSAPRRRYRCSRTRSSAAGAASTSRLMSTSGGGCMDVSLSDAADCRAGQGEEDEAEGRETRSVRFADMVEEAGQGGREGEGGEADVGYEDEEGFDVADVEQQGEELEVSELATAAELEEEEEEEEEAEELDEDEEARQCVVRRFSFGSSLVTDGGDGTAGAAGAAAETAVKGGGAVATAMEGRTGGAALCIEDSEAVGGVARRGSDGGDADGVVPMAITATTGFAGGGGGDPMSISMSINCGDGGGGSGGAATTAALGTVGSKRPWSAVGKGAGRCVRDDSAQKPAHHPNPMSHPRARHGLSQELQLQREPHGPPQQHHPHHQQQHHHHHDHHPGAGGLQPQPFPVLGHLYYRHFLQQPAPPTPVMAVPPDSLAAFPYGNHTVRQAGPPPPRFLLEDEPPSQHPAPPPLLEERAMLAVGQRAGTTNVALRGGSAGSGASVGLGGGGDGDGGGGAADVDAAMSVSMMSVAAPAGGCGGGGGGGESSVGGGAGAGGGGGGCCGAAAAARRPAAGRTSDATVAAMSVSLAGGLAAAGGVDALDAPPPTVTGPPRAAQVRVSMDVPSVVRGLAPLDDEGAAVAEADVAAAAAAAAPLPSGPLLPPVVPRILAATADVGVIAAAAAAAVAAAAGGAAAGGAHGPGESELMAGAAAAAAPAALSGSVNLRGGIGGGLRPASPVLQYLRQRTAQLGEALLQASQSQGADEPHGRPHPQLQQQQQRQQQQQQLNEQRQQQQERQRERGELVGSQEYGLGLGPQAREQEQEEEHKQQQCAYQR